MNDEGCRMPRNTLSPVSSVSSVPGGSVRIDTQVRRRSPQGGPQARRRVPLRASSSCAIQWPACLNGVVVSAQEAGLLPLSQHSMFVLPSLAYHDYEGVALNAGEKPRLVRDLGARRLLMLRNHGLLAVGRTVAEAFVAMYFFETSCMMQVRAQAGGARLRDVDQPDHRDDPGGCGMRRLLALTEPARHDEPGEHDHADGAGEPQRARQRHAVGRQRDRQQQQADEEGAEQIAGHRMQVLGPGGLGGGDDLDGIAYGDGNERQHRQKTDCL
ncbi:MAG: class II aldolase/adducin family protein [Nitrospira sp.]|nr:class II aldolase/adducin family protein [Nitrospira sp.]